jgi:hypothetical protein
MQAVWDLHEITPEAISITDMASGRGLIWVLWRGGALILVAFLAIEGQLVLLNRSMGRLEGQVGSMPASIAQSLLDKSKKDADEGKTADAQRSLQLAGIFLQTATQEKAKVDPAYFQAVSQQLAGLKSLPALAPEVHGTSLELAAYKSSLQPQPKVTGKEIRVVDATNSSDLKDRVTLNKITPGDFVVPPSVVRRLNEAGLVSGLVLRGAVPGVSQTLDGLRWNDVIFINVHIKYAGGETELRNVTFVNCTFEIVDSPRGTNMTNYVVLGIPQRLVIGSTSS